MLENKINQKISTLTEAPANIDKEEIELYIEIHDKSCLKDIKKYGNIGVGVENKTIIKCNSSNADKLINYIIMHPYHILLDQYTKTQSSSQAADKYDAFIIIVSKLKKDYDGLLIAKHKLP